MTTKTNLEAENRELRAALKRLLDRRPPARSEGERQRKPKHDPIWERTPKRCPHCGEEKMVIPNFGIRVQRGIQRSQPWCNKCRATTNYHNMPRKNRSVNNP
jgi:transcription elongation factor Elf1